VAKNSLQAYAVAAPRPLAFGLHSGYLADWFFRFTYRA